MKENGVKKRLIILIVLPIIIVMLSIVGFKNFMYCSYRIDAKDVSRIDFFENGNIIKSVMDNESIVKYVNRYNDVDRLEYSRKYEELGTPEYWMKMYMEDGEVICVEEGGAVTFEQSKKSFLIENETPIYRY